MKRYIISLIIFLSIVPSFGQQTVRLKNPIVLRDGTSLPNPKGSAEIIEMDKTIRIKTSKGMKFLSFDDVKEVVEKDGTIIWSYEDYNARMIKVAFDAQCKKNKNKKLLILPLKDDIYGYGETVSTFYDSLCYIMIDPTSGIEYFENNDIRLEDINDYHLINVSKSLGADIVIYGFTYKFDVPFKYSPTTTDPMLIHKPWVNNSWDQLITALVAGGQIVERDIAINIAGSYVNVTLFAINVDTGEKTYIMKNTTILKLG